MKKFIIKIVIFSLPTVLFILVTLATYRYSKLKVNLNLNEISEYEYLLMGDSQVQRLNGKLIAENVKNISSAAEHYYFSYNKLKILIENENHKINKVILGVSIHNFAPVYSRLFNLDYREGERSLERYLYFIPLFDEHEFINKFDKLPILKFALSVYRNPDWGGFYESNNSNPTTEIINKTFNMHFKIKSTEEEFSNSQRDYLYKIDYLCKENNIDLIIVSTPYHSKYKEQIKPEYYEFFTETIRNLNSKIHINFLSDKVDSNHMSDANHLNNIGATYYSEIISKELNTRTHNNIFIQNSRD